MRIKGWMWLTLVLLALAVFLAPPGLALAEETMEEPETETAEPIEQEQPPADMTAASATLSAYIDGLTAAEEVKARLRATAQERLREAVNRGFTAAQLQEMASEMTVLMARMDLGGDLPHLNACFQLMIKGMRAGQTAAEVSAMIAAKLAAGLDLKNALKETRFELKGKTPSGQAKEEKAEKGKKEEKRKQGRG